MKDLRIIDILHSPVAISPSAGSKVFEAINKEVSTNEPVRLFFEGIEDCTTAFCNATIGKLYMLHLPNRLDSLISFPDLENFPIWKDKIYRSIQLGRNEHLRNAHEDNLSDLLLS